MFKVGDKIQIVNIIGRQCVKNAYDHHDIKVGDIYEVIGINQFNPTIKIRKIPLDLWINSSGVKLITNTTENKVYGSMPKATEPTFRPLESNNIPGQIHKCNCNFRDLLMNGCQCGGI